jgi:hypothetical protein
VPRAVVGAGLVRVPGDEAGGAEVLGAEGGGADGVGEAWLCGTGVSLRWKKGIWEIMLLVKSCRILYLLYKAPCMKSGTQDASN